MLAGVRRAELMLVREVLEGVVSPTVATALLFEALEETQSSPPSSLEEMRLFALGPLDSAVRRKVRGADAAEIAHRVDALFTRSIEGDGLAIDVEFEAEAASDVTATAQMTTVKRPVPVLVISSQTTFAERLRACLGEDRVEALAVSDAGGLTRAMFAHAPVFVVVDAATAVPIDEAVLTSALMRLPDNTTPVLWASETQCGQDLERRAEREGVRFVSIARGHGIEPLLDLVLSRFAP